MNIHHFKTQKQAQQKISMVTCYDAPSAAIIEQTEIDCVLVGDSVAMAVHGLDNTTHATMPMMVMHTQAVSRKIKSKFIVADMPFMSYRISQADTIHNVMQLVQAGAHAIKLEGCAGNLAIIRHIVESGVPVMGHIGLTPQSIHQLGGHKVQGRNEAVANQIKEQALALEQAGVFSLVLECVPSALAKAITDELSIPTIGIGAGPDTDGQVLVYHDLLGLQTEFSPKFLKRYHNAQQQFIAALNCYANEVKHQQFPDPAQHGYR